MVLSENTIYTRWFKHSRNPVKQTPSSKALILLIGPTEKQDKTATHDHCPLKVKIWVVYPTFSAESCEGLVGVKRKRTKKEREKIEKKKGRKEGRKRKENNIYQTETVSPSLEPKILCLPGKVLTTT